MNPAGFGFQSSVPRKLKELPDSPIAVLLFIVAGPGSLSSRSRIPFPGAYSGNPSPPAAVLISENVCFLARPG